MSPWFSKPVVFSHVITYKNDITIVSFDINDNIAIIFSERKSRKKPTPSKFVNKSKSISNAKLSSMPPHMNFNDISRVNSHRLVHRPLVLP